MERHLLGREAKMTKLSGKMTPPTQAAGRQDEIDQLGSFQGLLCCLGKVSDFCSHLKELLPSAGPHLLLGLHQGCSHQGRGLGNIGLHPGSQ